MIPQDTIRAAVRRGVGVLLAVVLAALVAAPPVDARTVPTAIPSVGEDFGDAGPYAVSTIEETDHTYFFPTGAGDGGVRHPVILWGNGTGATIAVYEPMLRHFASHGFVVAAAATTQSGTGTEMLAGLDNVALFDTTPGHPLEGAVDTSKVAATGHSQGGFGAVNAARDPRITTAFPMQGAYAADAVDGPVLILAGELDTTVTPALLRGAFEAAAWPAVYAEVADANHIAPILTGGFFRTVGTAWARWHLMGDPVAASWFTGQCALCSSPALSDYEVNARFAAAFGEGTFPDVPAGAYFRQPVRWAHLNGITTGYGGSGSFRPDLPTTRGEAVTFLWRAAGRPTGHPSPGFVDLTPGAYYTPAVAWAAAEGITTGIGGSDRFAPDGAVTRAQAVTFLYRAD